MHLHANLDAVLPGADVDARQGRVQKGVAQLWPFMPKVWDDALHNAHGPTTQSGSAGVPRTREFRKGSAHRA